MRIIVRFENGGYLAFLENHPDIHCWARTIGGAIGGLILLHPDKFNIEIVRK